MGDNTAVLQERVGDVGEVAHQGSSFLSRQKAWQVSTTSAAPTSTK
jgi:hypothetical protein